MEAQQLHRKFASVTVALAVTITLTACAGEQSVRVQAMQKKDKQLSCKEVLLEMNEAEFYRKAAEDKKGINIKSVVMPLGYFSTYMNAAEAIEAANSRVDYLNRIYDIMKCEEQQNIQQVNAQQPMIGRNMPHYQMAPASFPMQQPMMAYPQPYMQPYHPNMMMQQAPAAYYTPSAYAPMQMQPLPAAEPFGPPSTAISPVYGVPTERLNTSAIENGPGSTYYDPESIRPRSMIDHSGPPKLIASLD